MKLVATETGLVFGHLSSVDIYLCCNVVLLLPELLRIKNYIRVVINPIKIFKVAEVCLFSHLLFVGSQKCGKNIKGILR